MWEVYLRPCSHTLIRQYRGNIYYKDRDITRVDKKQLRELRKEMQMIFQDPYSSVNPRMTVSQTIAEPLIIEGEMSRGTGKRGWTS